MWKKDEGQPEDQQTADTTHRPATPRPTQPSGPGRATIGPSISIRGDVTGSEDLLIQGQIDGSVTLDDHSVGVGSEGRVNANITGRVITIEGRVEGDLTAQEQIILRGSAHVKGDIKAPRVVLEDGATFRGLVDMGMPRTKADEKAADGKVATSSKGGGASRSDEHPASTSDTKPSRASSAAPSGPARSPSDSSSPRPSSSAKDKAGTADRTGT
jgi:cytoskeletal protein CcmA (bactofilin family)